MPNLVSPLRSQKWFAALAGRRVVYGCAIFVLATALLYAHLSRNDYQPRPNPIANARLPFYVDPTNNALQYARSNPQDPNTQRIEREGEAPTATWFGDWNTDVTTDVHAYVAAAATAHALPVLVVYNIPKRDCGGYSSGGAHDEASYLKWVQEFSGGLSNEPAVIVLEPDAIAGADCLNNTERNSRYHMISKATQLIKSDTHAMVYIDAGNSQWQTADEMAKRLKLSGIANADGFSLNVSNYISTAENQRYGNQLSHKLKGMHYVIDSSRNGKEITLGSQWCNARNAALGSTPTTHTDDDTNDALLWIKIPWESGGKCGSDPAAGDSFWQYAVQLAKNTGW
jgi:endoglucanase